MVRNIENFYLRDLSKLEFYQIKNYYKCKNIVFK